jgi:hypothetical protein
VDGAQLDAHQVSWARAAERHSAQLSPDERDEQGAIDDEMRATYREQVDASRRSAAADRAAELADRIADAADRAATLRDRLAAAADRAAARSDRWAAAAEREQAAVDRARWA